MGDNCREAPKPDGDVIWSYDKPLVKDAGFLVLRGNLFNSAIMKTSVISKEFRDRYLITPEDLNAFEGRAIVFEGPEDYHHRIDDASLNIDEHCILFVRGTGPIGYPGGAEVVNMQPPAALIKRGILSLPCIGDGRQSGTSGSPSILNATPEAAANGGLAILRTGDKVRIDLNKGSANILISDEEVKARHAELKADGGFKYPANQTPWQELYRSTVGQQATGACMELATRYHDIAGTRRHRRGIIIRTSSSLRTQGPIATGLDEVKRSLTHCLNETPRRMGPCVRKDDAYDGDTKTQRNLGRKNVRPPQGQARLCHRRRRRHRPRRALAFAREGATVFATDIDEKGLAALKSEGISEVAKLDARDTAAVNEMAKRVGKVDILLNAAGFVHHGTVLECSDDDWDFSFDLNVKSMHRTIRAFLPGMLERGRGSIVNISSAAGVFKAAPNRYVYGATKAAVAALTRAVAVDFITKGIRCNCICPGTIETPSMLDRAAAAGPQGREMFISRQPMGRLGTADEIASLAVYLASDESAFTTGVAHIIDGGWTL